MDEYRQIPSIRGLLLTAFIIIVIVIYAVIAFNTSDAIWFWTPFTEEPFEIIVHCYGEESIIPRGTEEHQTITELFNQQVSGRKNWDTLQLSGETYEYYLSSDDVVVLAMHYPTSIDIHTAVTFFRNVDTLMLPLVGRHAWTQPIFGRTSTRLPNGMMHEYSATGSFHIQSVVEISEYLTVQGICDIP